MALLRPSWGRLGAKFRVEPAIGVHVHRLCAAVLGRNSEILASFPLSWRASGRISAILIRFRANIRDPESIWYWFCSKVVRSSPLRGQKTMKSIELSVILAFCAFLVSDPFEALLGATCGNFGGTFWLKSRL